MRRRSFVTMLLMLLTLPLSASAKSVKKRRCDPLPKELLGKWRGSKCPPNKGPGPCISKNYTLKAKSFVMVGYPALRLEGKLCVVATMDKNSWRVLFYETQMVGKPNSSKWKDLLVWVVLSKDKTITFNNFTFTRLK